MNPEQVIKLLSNDIKTLMRQAYISIGGGAGASPNGTAPVSTFQVVVDPMGKATGFTTGASGAVGVVKDRKFVRISKLGGAAKSAASLATNEFNAYYVPMVQTSDVGGQKSHYVLPTSGGPSLMITSQLSGCVFAVGMNATGDRLVSHVQPDKSIPADQRQADAKAKAEGGIAHHTGGASMGNGYDETAAIVGSCDGIGWLFYVQSCSCPKGVRHVNGVRVIDENGAALP